MSSAVAYRSAAFFAIARETMRSISGNVLAHDVSIGGGGVESTFRITVDRLSPSNARRPVNISYATTPVE